MRDHGEPHLAILERVQADVLLARSAMLDVMAAGVKTMTPRRLQDAARAELRRSGTPIDATITSIAFWGLIEDGRLRADTCWNVTLVP